MAGKQIILVQEEPRGPSQLVEVPVTKNGLSKVFFPDIQQLRSTVGQTIVIKAMRLITVATLAGGVISLDPTVPDSELPNITLVLYCEGWEKAQNIPIIVLNDVINPAGTTPYRFHSTRFANWRKVDWTKSFLQWVNTTASANAPYTVLFEVEYIKIDSSGEEIIGAS